MTPPLVSVIVLSHRQGEFPGAIDSVLKQTYGNIEIILKYHPGDLWPSKFNEAWAGAAGKYLAFLPDDDRLDPTWTQRCVEEAEDRDADLTFTNYYTLKGGFRFNFPFPEFDGEVLRMSCVPHMTFLVRRAFWANLPDGTNGQPGGWDDDQIRGYADWDAAIRMYRARARVAHVREFLYLRTIHENAGSVLMTTEQFDAALRMLRDKHSAMARDEPDRRTPDTRGAATRPL